MNNLAVLVSGNGSNLQAIIDACESGTLGDTRVALVVSNHKAAYALQRASRRGIPTLYHSFQPYRRSGRSREEYDADLASQMGSYRIDLVVLAGWMWIFTTRFLDHFSGRVLNIHPALPGMFPGTHAIERAWEAYQHGQIKHTGVMVHRVPDEGVDVGPVIMQRIVDILPNDTLESLEARIHRTEHALYVEAIAQALEQL